MYFGRCCVTEPRSRAALQLDIFIEILLGGWVKEGVGRRVVQCVRPAGLLSWALPTSSAAVGTAPAGHTLCYARRASIG
jgi:hypothetical protein